MATILTSAKLRRLGLTHPGLASTTTIFCYKMLQMNQPLSPWEKNEKIYVTSVLVDNFTDHAQLGVDKISLSHIGSAIGNNKASEHIVKRDKGSYGWRQNILFHSI
jgi:hypothetical protein